jgi:hypothetical protein
MNRTFLLSVLAVATLSLYGQDSQKIFAQKLVDEAMAKHPDVVILAMHAKSPHDPNYPIIAWGGPTGNKVRIGKKADEDDMRVINTGKENLEVAPAGNRFEVELPLQDSSKKTLGALGVVFPYKPGDNKMEFKKQAEQIRDELRNQIPNESKLFEPAQ